ncbi:hypothetical protein OOK39_02145 [Streptomyces sp. NBC_00264]|uniref:hypothetical protein n=1 Tax=unclassified Streptomyces TaxID=2593676 RepID=UPI002253390E|nr:MULTISPECIES: hypothetical protein [unclassified Streptomyces]MCX5158101.1 hypothetical protein [Streptomyces sp. NBC_00305]MCX5216624.1 hypothetical protein [Streptomyces sp. NBC_00264]
MTTSPPQLNGHPRPAMPVLGDWLPVADQSTPEPTITSQPEPTAPAVDLVAQAEADAIRTRAYAEAEEQRIKAEAAADALKIKAGEEARKLKLANDKAAARAAEEQAARDARIAESNRKREEAEREQAAARKAEQEQQEADAATAEEIAKAASKWRLYAVMFYAVCAVVALPVQIAAFWDPNAWWLVIAPLMLEGAALVVTKGAAAAVAAQRPHWHYRTVAWMFAFIAAGINLWHGMAAFDLATAIGTAFASLAGPGVWDLHEHGRIRKRDGVLSRRERKALKKAAKAEAEEKAAAERLEAERQAYREKAVREAAEKLAADRESLFPKVWDHALKLAADLGEHTVTDAIWKRAKRNVEGADPGEDAETLRMRNAAERRVAAARESTSVNTVSKTTKAQRAIQVKAPSKRSSYRPVPPRRKRGDTAPFHPVARALAADAKRQSNASTEEQK